MKSPRIAIVTDWLVGGGAERVVMALHELFPSAPIYTAYCNDASRTVFAGADIRTSYMQHWPFSALRKFLPIMRQHWFEHIDLSSYDLVISSSGAEAKGIRVPKGSLHINYCHSPTHYYWVRPEEYLENPGLGKLLDPIAKLGLKIFLKSAKKWDYKAAQRPDIIIANSTIVQKRIKMFYGRDSMVIYPPVDTKRFAPTKASKRWGFVTAGRQTPYKRIDLAVQACTMASVPLTVIGKGPEHERLKKMAGPTVTFLKTVSDSEMPRYFQSAEAFIFPNEDDFGIVPVEAMAAGTPVIAYRAGGALDTVIEGKTGLFFDTQLPNVLADTLRTFQAMSFDHEAIRKHALAFDEAVFKENFQRLIVRLLAKTKA